MKLFEKAWGLTRKFKQTKAFMYESLGICAEMFSFVLIIYEQCPESNGPFFKNISKLCNEKSNFFKSRLLEIPSYID